MTRPLDNRTKLILRKPLKHAISRRPHRLKGVGMTVCTASLFFWNYSPADKDAEYGPAIIAASDRALTDSGLGIGYEGSRFKGSVLPTTPRQLVLVAGELTTHTAVLRLLNNELQSKKTASTTQSANMVARLMREYRMREAAHTYLAPVNLDENSFLAQQRTMEPSLVIELANQLQGHNIGAEAIVVGCDSNKEACMYMIDNKGVVTDHSDIGFVSIGGGGIHSSAYFMRTSYTHATNYYRALYHTFMAKKRAEVDPFVGTSTDMFLINATGVIQIPQGVITALSKIYAENLQMEKHLPEDAEKKLMDAERLLFPQPAETPTEIKTTVTEPAPQSPKRPKGGQSRQRPLPG